MDNLEDTKDVKLTLEDRNNVKSLVSGFTFTIKRNDILELKMIETTSSGSKLCLLFRSSSNLDHILFERCVDFTNNKFGLIVSYLKNIK
jgi:hypothetical protein